MHIIVSITVFVLSYLIAAARVNGLGKFIEALKIGIVVRRHWPKDKSVFVLLFSDDGGEEKGRGRVRVAAVPTATIPRCCQPPIRLTSTPLATANIAVCKPVILGASVESVQRDPVDISVRVQTGLLNHRCYWRKTKCKQVTTSQKYVLLS